MQIYVIWKFNTKNFRKNERRQVFKGRRILLDRENMTFGESDFINNICLSSSSEIIFDFFLNILNRHIDG